MNLRQKILMGFLFFSLFLSACTQATPPTAKLSASPDSGTTNTLFEFDASESSGAITSYQWDFGDGSGATGKTASHQYRDFGTQKVTLTVMDDAGLKNSSSLDISVGPTRQEMDAVVAETTQRNIDLYEALANDEATQALDYLIFGGASAPPDPTPPPDPQAFAKLFTFTPEPGRAEGLGQPTYEFVLPRGTYELDETSGEFVRMADTSEFILRYRMPAPVEIVIDWDVASPTQKVSNGYDGVLEMPTDMLASMTVGGRAAAKFEAEASWYDAPECGGAILEPTTMSVRGFFGVDTRVSFELEASLTDTPSANDIVTTKGFFEIASGDVSEHIEWDTSVRAELKRAPENDIYTPACFIQDAVLASADLSLEVGYKEGETSESLALALSAEAVYEGAELVGADIEGQLFINGATAVDAKGRLDDSNGNGIPGENVTLTYADGSTESLEQYLRRSFVNATLRSVLRERQ